MEKCKRTMKSARILIGHVIDGKVSSYIKHSKASGVFTHEGYVNKSAPTDYRQKLDQIILLKFRMSGGSCQGPLVSTKVLYEEGPE